MKIVAVSVQIKERCRALVLKSIPATVNDREELEKFYCNSSIQDKILIDYIITGAFFQFD